MHMKMEAQCENSGGWKNSNHRGRNIVLYALCFILKEMDVKGARSEKKPVKIIAAVLHMTYLV